MQRSTITLLLVCLFSISSIISCSKSGSDDPYNPPDPCASKNIVVTTTTTDASGGSNNGSITVSASGSTGFTFSLNSGAFTSSSTFNNLAAGDYTITAKDSDGCTRQVTVRVNAADACSGKNFVFSPVITNADKCAQDGKLTINVTGGTGFQYRIDGGAYQSSNVFLNLSAGSHTVFAKDAAGCEKSSPLTVNEKPAGNLFAAVKSLLLVRCANCHTNGGSEGGNNWDADCNIVAKKDRIKVRAVDEGTMPQGGPPLTAAEKQKIIDWINAGGMHSN